MKSLVLLILTLLLFYPNKSFAQQPETLFANDVNHGGFGSLVYGITSVNGQAAFLSGTRGAWIIRFQDGHSVHLGLAGYRTPSYADAVNWTRTDVEAPELRTNYGGFEFEYVNNSYQLIHFGAQALIGSGRVRYRDSEISGRTSDDYFVIQPGANIHLNVTNWFRLSGGVFYRYTSNVDLEGTSDSELSGLTAMIGLRFGKF